MNPFESKATSRPGTYKFFVETFVRNLEIGESIKTSVNKSEFAKFRMNLWKIGEELNMKFKTAVSFDGELWVKRVE